jgi:hypothetical protein
MNSLRKQGIQRYDAKNTTSEWVRVQEGMGMNWQNDDCESRDATFNAVRDMFKPYGFAALRLRARLARAGRTGSLNQNPTHLPSEDGRGDSDSTPAC